MPGTKPEKTKSVDFEAAQEDREESRIEGNTEQQDLNQGGLDTGTHDSTRHGVEWGRAYQTRAKEIKPTEKASKKKEGVSKPGAKQD